MTSTQTDPAVAILWFRSDLRLSDNPALGRLLNDGYTPLPIYIHDDDPFSALARAGTASAWWLHHSLKSLANNIAEKGNRLYCLAGNPLQRLSQLCRKTGVSTVYWNRCYDPHSIERDRTIKAALAEQGIEVISCNANLLIEPWKLLKKDGTAYRVFTPFWKALHQQTPAREEIAAPSGLPDSKLPLPGICVDVDDLGLAPEIDWARGFPGIWEPGEDGSREMLDTFCDDGLAHYPLERDKPGSDGTSRLSPHLHFGEISPVQAWNRIAGQALEQKGGSAGAESWLRQLAWREFSYHLLYHFPNLAEAPLNPRYENFPWRNDYQADLTCWQRGLTGVPMVDAGMRELWNTGYMHNRVRMVTASFLTKNLLVPWQEGANWFMYTLVDADIANNSAGWQWVAGCGTDAAPYFRVFNPVLQGEKFDPQGDYIKHWIPELRGLSGKTLHAPWTGSPGTLKSAGVRLGDNYPAPLVDLRSSREAALQAWNTIRQ